MEQGRPIGGPLRAFPEAAARQNKPPVTAQFFYNLCGTRMLPNPRRQFRQL
jgi:hypothetical protein